MKISWSRAFPLFVKKFLQTSVCRNLFETCLKSVWNLFVYRITVWKSNYSQYFGKPPSIPDRTYAPEPCHDRVCCGRANKHLVHRVCCENVPKLSLLVKRLLKYLTGESVPIQERVNCIHREVKTCEWNFEV